MHLTQLRTTQLGATGLEITRVGFGAWAIGGGGWEFGWGPQEDDEESIAAIHRAVELGVNWIDTAAAYGFGRSEQVVGRALEGLAERPYVFTKASLVEGPGRRVAHNLKRDSILREAEASLGRLGVEAIDLYQIHWPIPEGDIDEGWAAFAELKEQGLARHIGVSNFSAEQPTGSRASAAPTRSIPSSPARASSSPATTPAKSKPRTGIEMNDTRIVTASGHVVPASRRGYILTAGVLLATMAGGTLPIPLYVLYERQMGFGPLGITVVFAACVIGTLGALVASGDLSDHIGRRKVPAAAVGGAAVSTALFLAASGTGVLIAARILSGLAAGFVTGTATAALAELQPRGDRQAAAVAASGTNMTGLGLGPLAAGIFAAYVARPARSVFWACLGICALAPAAIAVIPETVRHPGQAIRVRPRLGVPPGMRAVMTGACPGVFTALSIPGFFSSLAAAFLHGILAAQNLALIGAASFAVVLRTYGTAPATQSPSDGWCWPQEPPGGGLPPMAGMSSTPRRDPHNQRKVFVRPLAVTDTTAQEVCSPTAG